MSTVWKSSWDPLQEADNRETKEDVGGKRSQRSIRIIRSPNKSKAHSLHEISLQIGLMQTGCRCSVPPPHIALLPIDFWSLQDEAVQVLIHL